MIISISRVCIYNSNFTPSRPVGLPACACLSVRLSLCHECTCTGISLLSPFPSLVALVPPYLLCLGFPLFISPHSQRPILGCVVQRDNQSDLRRCMAHASHLFVVVTAVRHRMCLKHEMDIVILPSPAAVHDMSHHRAE